MKGNGSPPKILELLLGLLQLPQEKQDMLGNYEELYREKAEQSRIKADLWYLLQILTTIPTFFYDNIFWGAIMFLSFIKISLRQLSKNKLYSLINISSLVIGITAFLLMVLWVRTELIYDRHVENGDSIYRILINSSDERNLMFHAGMIDYMNAQDDNIDICGYGQNTYQAITHEGKNTSLKDVSYANPELLEYLDVDLVQGNSASVLDNPYSIIISQSASQVLFGGKNPIGEKLIVNNKSTFTISGIFKDIPTTSHIKFQLLTSFQTYRKMYPRRFEITGISTVNFYSRITKDSQRASISNAFIQWFIDNKTLDKEFNKDLYKIEFQPLYDIHMYSSDLVWDRADRIDSNYVLGAIVSGLLLLVLACFNFVNLSTAKSITRAKEFGLRKVIGSDNKQLLWQFMSESALFIIVSFLLSIVLILLLLPDFNSLTSKQFTIASFFEKDVLILISVIITLMIVVISIAPMIKFRNMSLVGMIKDRTFSIGSRNKPNKILTSKQLLVVTQFVITVVICSLFQVVNSQMEFMMNKNPGYTTDNIIILENPYGDGMFERYSTFADIATQIPGVISVASSNNVPGENIWNYCSPHVTGQSEEESKSVGLVFVQHNFFDILESKIKSGSSFLPVNNGEDLNSVILNESAAKLFGINEAGSASLTGVGSIPGPQNIIGIVEDLYTKSLYEEITPTIYMQLTWSATNIMVKVNSRNLHGTMANITKAWEQAVPDWPISYHFLDENINKLFEKERTILSLLKIFSLIAIFISAMGIFGLVSFTVVKKTKEIGIRKVLGASVAGIMVNIMKEFVLLILAANIIALPLSYYFATSWLQNFAFSISINLILFGMAGIIALMITLISAGIKIMHAANLPSVQAIKHE
ncbi:MAG: ABC transporter permease [Bacteroidetes bacterium]|nr:ABC transporter permease [Bacteroidota bacterium]